MTIELEKVFELANLMATLTNQKKILQEEFENSTLYFYNGGCFQINISLISFLSTLQLRKQNEVILIDENKLPIFIKNLDDFFDKIINHYLDATNKYYLNYQKLTATRSVQSILDL